MSRLTDYIHKKYPNTAKIGISKVFREKDGWKTVGPNVLSRYNIIHLQEIGITKISIHMISKIGKVTIANYSIEELIKALNEKEQ